MAVAAGCFLVLSFQDISGQPVIKALRIEADDLELPAVVVVVATVAHLPFHRGTGVISLVLVHPIPDGGVASQAFLVGYLIPQAVAFGAV